MTGASLYLVGTPIGNLEDLTARTRSILERCDVVLAEDTRVTGNLMRHLQLKKQLYSCYDHNEEQRAADLQRWNDEGKLIALVSDAGMPLVSDPGYRIVRRAIELGINVCPVPGPSSAILALVASGLPCERFAFEGFLPGKSGDRRRRLEKIRFDDRTLIFFVPLSELASVLTDMQQILGDRPACIAREITKMYEEFIRGSLSSLVEVCRTRQLKGEFVLVVEGASQERTTMLEPELRNRVRELLEAGGRLKEVSALLATESGWTSSQIYKLGLDEQEKGKACATVPKK